VSTLAEALVPGIRSQSRVVVHCFAALAGSLLVAGLAQVSIKLPFTPVPITGQTLGVLLVGVSLGPAWGVGSMLLYLAEGAVGLPFYAQGHHGVSLLKLSSATGGYLWGFVLAAWVVGWLARLGWDRSIRSSIGAMLIGEIVLYAVGVPWLMAALHLPLEKGLELGLYPFVIGDTLKLLAAAALVPGAWALVGKSRR
jgi:biotin transport system substrate-specific component